MTATRTLGIPKHSFDYGEYAWHLKWTIDVLSLQAKHSSGMIFKFTNDVTREEKLPLGGICPDGAWHGRLEGGDSSIPNRMPAHLAARICREALELFSGMAAFACQDCMTGTAEESDYYMVHAHVWRQAHPKHLGMLCLPCLQQRLGRRLKLNDFTDAPINLWSRRVIEFCADDVSAATTEN